MPKSKKPTNNNNNTPYCDSNHLESLLLQWSREDKPNNHPMSPELAKMILLIAENLIKKPTYKNVSPQDKEDMIMIAVLNSIKYCHSYNPDKVKSKNGAFTFITWNTEGQFKMFLKKESKRKSLIITCEDPFGAVNTI